MTARCDVRFAQGQTPTGHTSFRRCGRSARAVVCIKGPKRVHWHRCAEHFPILPEDWQVRYA